MRWWEEGEGKGTLKRIGMKGKEGGRDGGRRRKRRRRRRRRRRRIDKDSIYATMHFYIGKKYIDTHDSINFAEIKL